MNYFYKKTKLGYITIFEENNQIVKLKFGKLEDNSNFILSPLIKKTFQELDEYFEEKRKTFDIPINPKGTDFQKKVWMELTKIPYGNYTTYKDIAEKIGNENASRAIGNANNKNPILIIIPCHRVIGSNNKLRGYSSGINYQEKLLKIEKILKEQL